MEQVVRARGDRGFSLIEIMIALAVVSVALLGLLSLINSSSLVQDETRYRTIAYNAARDKIEEMRAQLFDSIYAAFNSITTDDAAVIAAGGTCPGRTFEVDGLPKNMVGGVAQPQGTIYFPEDVFDAGLLESPSDYILRQELGMPKDLNRNGVIDGAVIATYNLLPVKVEISYTAVGGKTIRLPIVTYITNR